LESFITCQFIAYGAYKNILARTLITELIDSHWIISIIYYVIQSSSELKILD